MGEMGRWGENKERGLKRLAYRTKPTNQKLPLLSFFLSYHSRFRGEEGVERLVGKEGEWLRGMV